MKMRWTLLLSLSLFGILPGIVACSEELPKTTQPVLNGQYPLVLIDSNGEKVEFQSAPTRIVSLSPAMTEIMFSLGAQSRLVGRDDFSDFPSQAKNVQALGSAFNVSLEQLVALEPDLVYITFDQFKPALETAGLRVLYLLPPRDIDGVLQNIYTIGSIVDRAPQATTLVQQIQDDMLAIEQKLALLDQGPSVFYELDPLLFTAGPNTFIGDLLSRLRLSNIVAPEDGDFPQLSPEVIIKRDPEVILLADSPEFTHNTATPQTVEIRPGWTSIRAVREGKIYSVNPDLISRPGPRLIRGMETIAKLIYPDEFQ